MAIQLLGYAALAGMAALGHHHNKKKAEEYKQALWDAQNHLERQLKSRRDDVNSQINGLFRGYLTHFEEIENAIGLPEELKKIHIDTPNGNASRIFREKMDNLMDFKKAWDDFSHLSSVGQYKERALKMGAYLSGHGHPAGLVLGFMAGAANERSAYQKANSDFPAFAEAMVKECNNLIETTAASCKDFNQAAKVMVEESLNFLKSGDPEIGVQYIMFGRQELKKRI